MNVFRHLSTLTALAVSLLSGSALLSSRAVAQLQNAVPVTSENSTLQDELGATAALEATFLDEDGRPGTLRSFVSGERPIVLNLGYFSCPKACGPILANILDAMQNADLMPGRDLDILSVSVDEREGPNIAKPKQAAYIDQLGQPLAVQHWRFLTGEPDAIKTIADSVGYRFERLQDTGIIDHPPVIVLLSPTGVVTRYINGETMDPVTFERAIIEAGQGTVGSFLDRILVSCLTYDSNTGVYQLTAMTIMQVGGGLTVLALGTMIFVLYRREKKARAAQAAGAEPTTTPAAANS